MQRRLSPIGLTLSFGLIMSACGGSTSAIDQACSAYANAECAKLMSCTNGSGVTRDYGDLATCQTRLQLSCTLGAAAPSTGSTVAHIQGCTAAYANYDCADYLTNNPPAACIAMGTITSGAACAFAGQCASSYCINNKTTLCGTCGAAPITGTSCVASGCARQDECEARTETCVPYGAAQASCDNNTMPCGPHLSCIGNNNGNPGTCMTSIATMGTACGGTLGGCDGTIGLTCSGTTKTCVTEAYAANGQPCGTLSDGTFGSCATGECYTGDGIAQSGETGTCGAAAADGQPCDTALGPPCLTPARCIVVSGGTSGSCTLPTNPASCM
jgi:hypothetical protein